MNYVSRPLPVLRPLIYALQALMALVINGRSEQRTVRSSANPAAGESVAAEIGSIDLGARSRKFSDGAFNPKQTELGTDFSLFSP